MSESESDAPDHTEDPQSKRKRTPDDSSSSSSSSSNINPKRTRFTIPRVKIMANALLRRLNKPGGIGCLFPTFFKQIDLDLDYLIGICVTKDDKMIILEALAERFIVLGYN